MNSKDAELTAAKTRREGRTRGGRGSAIVGALTFLSDKMVAAMLANRPWYISRDCLGTCEGWGTEREMRTNGDEASVEKWCE